MPGSSSVSIESSDDVSVLLLFLENLHSRPSCALSPGHSDFLSSKRHQRCLYGQAQQLKLWSKVQCPFWARSLRSARANSLLEPAVWAKDNAEEEEEEEEEEEFLMLRPVNKTDHMQQGTKSLHSIISL